MDDVKRVYALIHSRQLRLGNQIAKEARKKKPNQVEIACLIEGRAQLGMLANDIQHVTGVRRTC